MFWDKWIPRKFLVKSEIFAVEALYGEQGLVLYYTHLKNKKNKLEIVETGILNKLELPGNVEKNKISVLLIVNGSGLIIKKIALNDTSVSTEDIIAQNFPALNTQEFYIQLYRQNDSAFVSLCRKENIKELLNYFQNGKYDLAGILLGAPAIVGLKPLWSELNAIQTNLHRIELTNGELDVITSATDKTVADVEIDGLNVSHQNIVGFAGGFSYFIQNNIAETNNEELLQIQTKHQEKNKFRVLLSSVVAIAFVLAIVNVVFYTSYFDKNNKLETELSVYQGKYEQVNNLLADYQKNKDLIENAGVLNKNRLSEYADKIGKTIPDEVVLSEMYFNPKNTEEESEDSLVTFYSKQLILKGNCGKSFIINEWLNILKMQKFIKDVNLERFVYNSEGHVPNFEIKLETE
jgi:hypothetical protein